MLTMLLLSWAAATPDPAVATPDPATEAAVFGARETVAQASLSPDGKSVAFVAAGQGRSSVLMTGTPDAGLKVVLRSSGDPEHLRRCRWSTNTRLVCDVTVVTNLGDGPTSFTRIMSLDRDGSNLKMLSAGASARALGVAYNGGQIIDWLSEAGSGKVLMTRAFVPEMTTGTRVASDKKGLGLERVDTTTLARVTVEQPAPGVVEYITDGHGQVRIRGVRPIDGAGRVSNTIIYYYRPTDGGGWKPLSQRSVVTNAGFDPYAVDRDLNVAYGFERLDGRQAFYKVALDGSGRRELVLSRPDVDVDGLIRVGRQGRVVGVSFATDKRVASFFDPELKALSAKLSRALPGAPAVTFIDASDDESKLLLWAGSDVDPGRYYLYDKATRQLAQLLETRPALARLKLSSVEPITYPAADGTQIPGYLTLPPGVQSAKGLPALVLPHGGPSARDEWGFDWLSQYWAQRGYAVLQPNFRGSSGYGEAWFQKNGFQSWRTAVGDVADGGRWLVKQGARADRLAIFGWSYGGYAALQAAVLDPGLFKAVVAVAPVTDLATLKAEARDYSNLAEFEAFIGTGPHVREGSPAQNARAIKAPVMMFHGDLDQNVAINQSRLMADRLRDAGATPQLTTYKGLDHQLDDSSARADMLAKSDAFLRAAMGL